MKTVDPDEPDKGERDEQNLLPRQQLFVRAYVGKACFNASVAAKMAGYRREGKNKDYRYAGYRTLQNPFVQRAISRELNQLFGSPEQVKNGIAAIANSSAADFLTVDARGNARINLKKMAEAGALGNVAAFETDDGKIKIKFWDKLKALEILAKMNGQLIERKDITSGDKPIKVFMDIDDGDESEKKQDR